MAETLVSIVGSTELHAACDDLSQGLAKSHRQITKIQKLIGRRRELPSKEAKDQLLIILREGAVVLEEKIIPLLERVDGANATSKAVAGITLDEYRHIEQLMTEQPALVRDVRTMWSDAEDGEWSSLVLRDLARWVRVVEREGSTALNTDELNGLAEDFLDGLLVEKVKAEETEPWQQVKADLGL